MKKLLSTFLAVAMLICTFVPMTASAAIDTITLPTEAGEFVLMLAALLLLQEHPLKPISFPAARVFPAVPPVMKPKP